MKFLYYAAVALPRFVALVVSVLSVATDTTFVKQPCCVDSVQVLTVLMVPVLESRAEASVGGTFPAPSICRGIS